MSAPAVFTLDARWWAFSWKAIRRFASNDLVRLPLTGVAYTRAKGGDEWTAYATDSYRFTATRSMRDELPAELGPWPASFLLTDEFGALDLLARRILHRFRPTISKANVPEDVTFTIDDPDADGSPVVVEWGPVGVTAVCLNRHKHPSHLTLWKTAVESEATWADPRQPVAFDPRFLADYAAITRIGPAGDRWGTAPRLSLVRRGDAMKAVLWELGGALYPVWSLQMPVRVS